MNIKSILSVILFAAITLPFAAIASGHDHDRDPYAKTFITNRQRTLDVDYQNQLRNSQVWQQFISTHGQWNVVFNEESGLPQRAYGKPIVTAFSNNPKEVADAFLNNDLASFGIPYNELVFRNTTENSKYYYVNYKQFHNNLEVMWADIQVKMTKDGRIMLFGLDVHNNINLGTTPSLSEVAAIASATAGLNLNITSTTVNPALKILPVPAHHSYVYHLVYEITVDARDAENFRSIYYTLVDAITGEIMYRQNRVNKTAPPANTDVNMTGTLYTTNPYNPSSVEPLKYQRIIVGAIANYTDNTGYLGLTNTSPVSATIQLRGLWANVKTNGVTPSWVTTLNPGANNLSYDASANIKEMTAYRAVQEVHDHFKNLATGSPAEMAMDFEIGTNVDVAGSCNAYYDGEINFFDAGGGCNATSLVADVVYHEYGHGVNYEVYNAYGGFFGNGALGEGYADTWANGITEDPILGIGFFAGNPTGFVRRYDIDKKVYPQDLTGEVHADGEIIAGCWWDVGLNFNSHPDRQELFYMTFSATLDEPDGSEGILFFNVLIEALTDDDNDGDITNGTPRYCEITSAFALHGIFVSGGAVAINHSEVLSTTGLAPITVDAAMTSALTGSSVSGYYKINGQGTWTNFTLNNVGGLSYQGTIPGQPNGTIINYYLDITDNCGTHVGVTPQGADDAVNPNIPFYILVGYNLLQSQTLESTPGSWTTGVPGDNAITGMWELANPVATYVGNAMVQTGDDHTLNPGVICAITGAAAGSGVGDYDIDGGETTLISETYDLSTYTNPAFTYWRWYSNDQGATPGTDFWQVAISNDGGSTWTDVENINVSDHSWRRFAFKVTDYVIPTADVKLRFIAEDANAGSLVEAGVDDAELWDAIPTSIYENNNISFLSIYPNPVKDELNIRWNMVTEEALSVEISDNAGRLVYSAKPVHNGAGSCSLSIPVTNLSNGLYILTIKGNHSNIIRKINILD